MSRHLRWMVVAALAGCAAPAVVDQRGAAPIEASLPSKDPASGPRPSASTSAPASARPSSTRAPVAGVDRSAGATRNAAPANAADGGVKAASSPVAAQTASIDRNAAADSGAKLPPRATDAATDAAPLPQDAAVSAPTSLPPGTLPGWLDDPLDHLHAALARQCTLRRPPDPWPALCTELPPPARLKAWVAARFIAAPLARGSSEVGLLTGYYEPVLSGSRQREHAGQVPLYRRPADLAAAGDGVRQRLVNGEPHPYPTRQQIETEKLLAGQELVWLDDAIEAFFIQVQGSGRVRLRDGSLLRVGYADHNGQPYYAIGRELIARGELAADAVDADAIKAWLRANPAQAEAVMHSNPRYIFFRELPPSPDGPPGSLGVPLTPLRSVATDPVHVPPGSLLYIDSTHPDDGRPLRRLVVSQDRGAAITGAVRADLYWGTGDEAGRLAGRTRQPARMWLLRPIEAAQR